MTTTGSRSRRWPPPSDPLSIRRCSGAPRPATNRLMMATVSWAVQVRADVHGEGLGGVFVDDVAQRQPPAIRGLVELEVDGPHVVRLLGAQRRPAARRTVRLRLHDCGRRSPSSPTGASCACGYGVTLPAQDRVRRFQPHRGCMRVISRSRRRTFSSASGRRRGMSRWVERCWPTTWQARRSDTPKRSTTARRRRSRVRSFPRSAS
jgi:hypothetical protein